MSQDDLFTPVVPDEALHPSFRLLLHPSRRSARETMQAVFEVMPDPDGTFVRDFQTVGFDARVWELYLFGWGVGSGLYEVDRPHARPDFRFVRDLRSVWMEAVIASAGDGDRAFNANGMGEEEAHRLRSFHFVPIRLGSPLFSKLKKAYWELPWVAQQPLVIAIADFHDPDPYRDGSHLLGQYLYGSTEAILSDRDQDLQRALDPLGPHRIGNKEIPTNFFGQAGSENISAVLFSNAGTVSKFSRMGYDRNGHNDLKMIRSGIRANFDPNGILPTAFAYVVGSSDDQEHWGDGMEVFHNPAAKIPLPPQFFVDAVEHRITDSQILSTAPNHATMSSVTVMYYDPDHRVTDDYLRRRCDYLREAQQQVLAASEDDVRRAMRPGSPK